MAAWNFEAVALKTGKEGIAVLRHARNAGLHVDAVILDIQMPDLNGIEVLEIMRNDEMLQHTPVVMLTSIDNPETSREVKRLGIQANLTKPARSSLLLETLVQTITDYRVAGQSRKQIAQENPDLADPAFVQNSIDILIAEDNEVNQIVLRQNITIVVGEGSSS